MAKFEAGNKEAVKKSRHFKSKVFEAIIEEELLDITDEKPHDIEVKLLGHIMRRALDASDPQSATLLKEVNNKMYAPLRATMPTVEFDFKEGATPLENLNLMMKSVSEGELPPDVANTFITAYKAIADIEMATELKERIDKLEALLDERTS